MSKSSARERFFAGLSRDWPSPGLNEQIQSSATAFTPSVQMGLKIAVVGGDEIFGALSRITLARRLDADRWKQQLSEGPVDLVLLCAEGLIQSHSWRSKLAKTDTLIFWTDFCNHCAEMNIPTVGLFTGNRYEVRFFSSLLKNVSHVFVHSSCAEYLKDGGRKIHSIPAYIDSSVFNPYQDSPEKVRGVSATASVVMARVSSIIDSNDKSEIRQTIEPLLKYRFWLYEDRYDLRNNNQRLTPVERSRFLGCFRGAARAALLKNATFELFPNALYSPSSARDERHLYESLATKTVALSDVDEWQHEIERRYGADSDVESILHQFEHKRTEQVANAIDAHLGWRRIIESNSFYELLEFICRSIGVEIEYLTPKNAFISCIMPTVRPELIPMAVEFYQAQKYSNRELIIIVNTDDYDRSAIDLATESDSTIQVLYAPSNFTIGGAMNIGISNMRGDYWAKLDDDDYYSPNYLYDINLYRKHLNFDVAGKGSVFNYLEETNTTILRSFYQRDRSVDNLAGGTFVAKRDAEKMYWSETVRGYADIEFLTRRLSEGANIASLDPFNYVQVRRADERSHTWTKQASFLRPDFVCDSMNLSSIFV